MVPCGVDSAMLKVTVISTSGQLLADTLTLMVAEELASGVPLITPLLDSDNPVGRTCPLAGVNVGVCPLLTVT